MVSAYTKRLFVIPSVWDMTGSYIPSAYYMCLWSPIHYLSSSELPNGKISIHLPQWELWSQPMSCQKCLMMYMWSRPFNSYLEIFYHTLLPTETMLLTWISEHLAAGVCNNRVHFLMYRFLTPMHPPQKPSFYKCHEEEKWSAYEQCILDSFTPLIFSTSGGMGRATTVAYKNLTSITSIKQEHIRCHLSFSLLHSAIVHERSMFEAWYVPRLETPLELIIHIQWPCSSCSYCLSFCFIFFLPPIGSFLALHLTKYILCLVFLYFDCYFFAKNVFSFK